MDGVETNVLIAGALGLAGAGGGFARGLATGLPEGGAEAVVLDVAGLAWPGMADGVQPRQMQASNVEITTTERVLFIAVS
jgi:hypothetical protein